MRNCTQTACVGTGLLVVLGWAVCAGSARGAEADTPPAGQERKAPHRITGRFEPVKRQLIVDEPILVDFIVKNDGDQPFGFATGGDYRRAGGRHERFSVEVVSVNGKRRDPRLRLETGNGLGGGEFLKPGETYRERLFLNTWDDFSVPGKYTVTCRRVLTNWAEGKEKPGWVTVRLDRLPMDITRPDAREQLLKRFLAGPMAVEAERPKIISAIDAYLAFPQVQTTFEIEVAPRDPAKLRALVAGLEEDWKVWPTAHWYLLFVAEKLGVETRTRTERGIGAREIPLVKADVLKKLDEQATGEKTPARLK